MSRLIIRICLTLIITAAYCYVWGWFEKMIEGCIVNRTVDNIMMVLFIPIIFIATDSLVN